MEDLFNLVKQLSWSVNLAILGTTTTFFSGKYAGKHVRQISANCSLLNCFCL